jgi:predicted  nucleic acid-binding Zn-ribbon protein
MTLRQFALLTLPFSIFLKSCGDDPKLVEKREKQRAEIVRLKGELAFIEEKLKSLPPDVTTELAEAKQLSAKQTAEVAGLEKEVAELESRKRTLQADFDSYKLKYQLK